MGQKSNPIGMRLGIIRSWDSRWFAGKEYVEYLHEDLWIKKYLREKLAHGEISRIEIERPSQKKLKVTINTGKPGVVIGKGGKEIQDLKAFFEKKTNRQVYLSIQEVKDSMMDATLVSQNVAGQLERRVGYRRAMKRTIEIVMAAGAEGVKIKVAGRLGGAEIARKEEYSRGRVPLHTLRADIDYGFHTAKTSYGAIGVKVWIFHGEVLDTKEKSRYQSARRVPLPGEVLAEADPRPSVKVIKKETDTPGAVDVTEGGEA
jgi:small subunit ribosomal protein S3